MKVIGKFLSLSNSYNYYKSNYESLKKQLEDYKLEKVEFQKNQDMVVSNLKNLQENQAKFLKTIQKNQNELKSIREDQIILKTIQNELKNGIHSMENDIYSNRILQNLASIKKETTHRKINVIFLINFQIASLDSIIHLLNEDQLFNVKVLVIPYDPHGLNIFEKGLNEAQLKDYNDNYHYFEEKGFYVIKGYDEKSKDLIDLESLKPDLLFYSTPWENQLPEQLRIKNLPQNILFCYVPYGIYAAQMQDDQFNREIHNKAWKIFSETKIHKKLAAKYSKTGSSNVVVAGYPKMDPLIDGEHSKNPYKWKNLSKGVKRIIWAPHHSIGWSSTGFSTFDKNYEFFYEYAKTHSDIEWVFKPHPALRHASIFFPPGKAGNFSEKNLDKYYDSWNDLPNASVYEGGDYFNLFATSNAMITDSVSFLSEYLYTGKPGLFLTRPEQKFNEFGEIVKEAWYQVDGKDFNKIESFIDKIIIRGEDPLKGVRENIYNKYLNTQGVTASSKIYSYIKNTFKQ